MTSFHKFLKQQIASGGFSTEDVLVSFVPLVRQVIETHQDGRVAPLEGIEALQTEGRRIWYHRAEELRPRNNLRQIRKTLHARPSGVHVVQESISTFDVDDGTSSVRNQSMADDGDTNARPVWLSGYRCWEHVQEHHDPITDVFSLGLILASLACRLDFTNLQDHEQFVEHRNNLFRVEPELHPVVARTISVMTELDRHDRPPDLRALLATLENYRDQEVDFLTDFASQQTVVADTPAARRCAILEKLRERLFEINRRNRLLHFRTTMQTVNLTQASIPLSFDVTTIRPDQVLTWDGAFRKGVLSQKSVILNKYLNFREAVYLPGTLDRIRAEARRDENDYGFAQLRLVVAFLRWADLKVEPAEQYESPFLLVPVKLNVKKGIHDRYSVEALDTQAEVNPVVRHLFRQLYDIVLPEFLERRDFTIRKHLGNDLFNAHLSGDGFGGGLFISGDHGDFDSTIMQGTYGISAGRFDRIGNGYHRCQRPVNSSIERSSSLFCQCSFMIFQRSGVDAVLRHETVCADDQFAPPNKGFDAIAGHRPKLGCGFPGNAFSDGGPDNCLGNWMLGLRFNRRNQGECLCAVMSIRQNEISQPGLSPCDRSGFIKRNNPDFIQMLQCVSFAKENPHFRRTPRAHHD